MTQKKLNKTDFNVRIKAIMYSLYHGFMHYWVYESSKHYNCSYFQHLWINITYAFRWMTFREDKSDIEFERSKNNNYENK